MDEGVFRQKLICIYNIQRMSKHINHHFRESKPQSGNIRDFTYSVDIKKFSRDRGNMTPIHQHTSSIVVMRRYGIANLPRWLLFLIKTFLRKICKPKENFPRDVSSLIIIVQILKTNHHSVSIDSHLLKEKYNNIKELYQSQKYEKLIPLAKQIVYNYQYSNAQKNLYYWLAVSLGNARRYEQAVDQMNQCLSQYPAFQEGYLYMAHLQAKLKNYKLAVQNIQHSIKINPKNSQPYMQLAYCYHQMREFEQQRNLLIKMVDKFPKEGLLLMMLIESFINLDEIGQCQTYIKKSQQHFNLKDSLFLYIRGLIQKQKNNENEAYILFEQSLKYNNNKIGVNKALLQTIKIEIDRRDFYKAHHSVNRIKFLDLQQTEQIKVYSILIEGVMTMMKKKSQQSIDLLLRIVANKKCQQLNIQGLLFKYLGYGYFKISEYGKSIKYYQKLNKSQIDFSSHYNRLLAEGIQLADRQQNYSQAINKFNAAKNVYPQKVEPYIYIAMVLIERYNGKKQKDQIKRAQVLIQALKELQQGNRLNPNSSNLLYHRTIIHLYFEDWQQAHDDINRCIEKAEQNLPKYFYLRGVCYSCIKDFKKAINEFSICLSLDVNYYDAHLQKAKCYFLLGNTQKGFGSLKMFMELNPNDFSIYKWIGDLLYEGMSYRDALKAYHELNNEDDLQTAIMKVKCLMRVGTYQQIALGMKAIQKNCSADRGKVNMDMAAFNLLGCLVRGESSKVLGLAVKKLNKLLEQNVLGYVFLLIDCMSLLGVASFYLQKYSDAYESFLLVLELYQSLTQKQTVALKSQECQAQLDLRTQDIYFNIIICQLAQCNFDETVKMINNEYLAIVSDVKQKKKIDKLVQHIKSQSTQIFQWDFKNQKPNNSRFRKVQISANKLKLRTKPVFNMYHDNAPNLYASYVAEKLINQLHAGFIDNMPEGPWIKRNPFGVVFTEDMMPSENSLSLEDTFRHRESKQNSSFQSQALREQQSEKKTISKKQQFLKKIRFDTQIEAKLNSMINRSQTQGNNRKQI